MADAVTPVQPQTIVTTPVAARDLNALPIDQLTPEERAQVPTRAGEFTVDQLTALPDAVKATLPANLQAAAGYTPPTAAPVIAAADSVAAEKATAANDGGLAANKANVSNTVVNVDCGETKVNTKLEGGEAVATSPAAMTNASTAIGGAVSPATEEPTPAQQAMLAAVQAKTVEAQMGNPGQPAKGASVAA